MIHKYLHRHSLLLRKLEHPLIIQLTRVVFFERHLISTFVEQLLFTSHIEGCFLPLRIECIEKYYQLWSIHIGCGQDTHGWTFVIGEKEHDRSTPMITPRLYHSTLCAKLTWTTLAILTNHLGLYVPSSKY